VSGTRPAPPVTIGSPHGQPLLKAFEIALVSLMNPRLAEGTRHSTVTGRDSLPSL
jgi:hypothetical protein